MPNAYVEFNRNILQQSIPQRVEEIVARQPESIALKTTTSCLTWDDLNYRANGVARAIMAQREGSGEPVALLIGDRALLMTAILGVLKAAKFYVPLDPSHPHDRNNHILNDSQSRLIISHDENIGLAHSLARNQLKVLNLNEIDLETQSENLDLSISPDSLSNLVYTSGSTGQPKGVMHTHLFVLHRMLNSRRVSVSTHDRVAAVGAAGRDIFRPMLNGAGSFPWNVKLDGLSDLCEWLIQEKITIYHSVPTLFRHFIGTLTGEERFPHLRLINLRGEQVHRGDVELYKRHFSDSCRLSNELGTTETGSFRQNLIDKTTEIANEVVPVGYPVQGKEVLLLDDGGKEVGIGLTGEIAVRSKYLSPGYWREPELTRARFLPDPRGGDERIYLTGDVGRILPDGCLLHEGRKDLQVKIRGNRVEVSEIETALLQLEAFREVAVAAKEDEGGQQTLAAYLVPKGRLTPTSSSLRSALLEKLPDYMIPSAFVMLDSLPLTPNGKVDLKALPSLDEVAPDPESVYVAPRTEVESAIVQIWEDVLDIDEVGVHDNFFDLGGHSLSAMEVVSRIEKRFGVTPPLGDLAYQTLAQLASMVEKNEHVLVQEQPANLKQRIAAAVRKVVSQNK